MLRNNRGEIAIATLALLAWMAYAGLVGGFFAHKAGQENCQQEQVDK